MIYGWRFMTLYEQETGIKIIPMGKKYQKKKKAKWLSEEALQTNSCEMKKSEKQRRKGKI